MENLEDNYNLAFAWKAFKRVLQKALRSVMNEDEDSEAFKAAEV